MRKISISEKDARALAEHLRGPLPSPVAVAFRRLEAALQPKRSVLVRRKLVSKKKRSKREETRGIREAVFERSRGLCDYCRAATPTDLEHPFGRIRVKQSVETCLAVCRPCHRNRTNLVGGAVTWWRGIAKAFERYSLYHSAHEATRLAAYHLTKGNMWQAAKVGGGA